MADTYRGKSSPQQSSIRSLNCRWGELIESNPADKGAQPADVQFVIFKGSRTHARLGDIL
jgi:hypothetical protein